MPVCGMGSLMLYVEPRGSSCECGCGREQIWGESGGVGVSGRNSVDVVVKIVRDGERKCCASGEELGGKAERRSDGTGGEETGNRKTREGGKGRWRLSPPVEAACRRGADRCCRGRRRRQAPRHATASRCSRCCQPGRRMPPAACGTASAPLPQRSGVPSASLRRASGASLRASRRSDAPPAAPTAHSPPKYAAMHSPGPWARHPAPHSSHRQHVAYLVDRKGMGQLPAGGGSGGAARARANVAPSRRGAPLHRTQGPRISVNPRLGAPLPIPPHQPLLQILLGRGAEVCAVCGALRRPRLRPHAPTSPRLTHLGFVAPHGCRAATSGWQEGARTPRGRPENLLGFFSTPEHPRYPA